MTLPAVVLLVLGCGGGGTGPASTAPLEALSACVDAWKPVTSPAPFDVISPLVYAHGNVYFSTSSSQAIQSIPEAGGVPTTVAMARATSLWLEGETLVFTGGALGSQFFSVPLAGGTPQLLLDGAAGRTDAGASSLSAATASDFFWTETQGTAPSDPTAVWRAPRAGGAHAKVGEATAQTPSGDVLAFEGMALTTSSALLGAGLGLADLVPLAGGDAMALPSPDGRPQGGAANVFLAGVYPLGVFWGAQRPFTAAADDAWDLVLSPSDGSVPHSVWQGLPDHSAPDHIWSDGAGGWIISAQQLFADGRSHTTIWSLTADLVSKRLGCAPTTTSGRVTVQPAVGPDAVFVVAQDETWQMVKLAR
jgi:hypothetical protein